MYRCALDLPILVKLYGRLGEKVKELELEEGLPVSFYIERYNIHFVCDILEKFEIQQSELSHIFVNGKYSEVGKEVTDGDRIGLFPKNMALLFVEILPQFR